MQIYGRRTPASRLIPFENWLTMRLRMASGSPWKRPHIGTLAENVARTRRFFQLLQDPRVACTFDTSHVARGNPVPVPQSISAIGAEIGHVHLRDCIGENNHLTPGKGEIDFKGVLHELIKIGYAGSIIFELEGENSQQAATELAYAINYLRQLDL